METVGLFAALVLQFGAPASVIVVLILRKSRILRIAILLTLWTAFSLLPIFPSVPGTYSHSYLDPLGFSSPPKIEYDGPIGGRPDIPLSGKTLIVFTTYGTSPLHFLIADIAALFWVLYIVQVVRKGRSRRHPIQRFG